MYYFTKARLHLVGRGQAHESRDVIPDFAGSTRGRCDWCRAILPEKFEYQHTPASLEMEHGGETVKQIRAGVVQHELAKIHIIGGRGLAD